jgi:hypothetical protein
MGLPERATLIAELERLRSSHLICYLTSTRPNTSFQIGNDIIARLYEHLKALTSRSDQKRPIDLVIHSNGGEGVVPWRLVTLIREYTSKFNVLVPHRAFSAATLIALGADMIHMHPMGVLGPTDPTVGNPFNPVDPNNPQARLGISVEDVYAYIALVKEDLGIKGETELVQAFKSLTEQLHPLALGNVKRFYAQSRMMARKLLELHMSPKTEHSLIQDIADNLTSKLYFHGHPINRTEAKALGLSVKNLETHEEELLWKLYSDFADEMTMEDEFNPVQEFIKSPQWQAALAAPGLQTAPIDSLIGAVIESDHGSHSFRQDLQVVGGRAPNGTVQASVMVMKQGWRFASRPAPLPGAKPV